GVLANMGQIPFEPPNVAGWPGNATWLNSATMFARLNLLNLATSGGLGRQGPAARTPAPTANLPGGTTAQALDRFLPLLLDDNLSAEARQVLLDYGGGPDANLSPNQLRGLAYLVLGSPQFHLS
ncbi:MAG TPA: DUF1800 family protein, partial [Dehalococcoidia bacterium]|nr:DUF1800 family protein [Dehalococcoidia bacterium]